MTQQARIGKHATSVKRSTDGTLTVRYHWTDVVTVYPNGKMVLDTGGYFTPTTKTRMNQAAAELGLAFAVFQRDFQWFVAIDGHTLEFTGDSLTIRNGS